MLRARRKYWKGLSYFGLDTKKSLSLSKCPNYVTVRTYFVTHFNNFTLFTRSQPLSGFWISKCQYKFYTLLLLILYKGNIQMSGFNEDCHYWPNIFKINITVLWSKRYDIALLTKQLITSLKVSLYTHISLFLFALKTFVFTQIVKPMGIFNFDSSLFSTQDEFEFLETKYLLFFKKYSI